MEKLLVVMALVMNSVHLSQAYGSGAPARACVALQPIHSGVVVQPTASPYNFSLSSSYYTPGTPLTVTITGAQFGGFLLQARQQTSTTSAGTFTVTDSGSTKLLQCQSAGDSITHTSPAAKTNLQLTWNPPSSDVGTVVFMGSVAQSHETWWGTMSSGPVMYRGAAGQVQVSLAMTSLAAVVAAVSRLL